MAGRQGRDRRYTPEYVMKWYDTAPPRVSFLMICALGALSSRRLIPAFKKLFGEDNAMVLIVNNVRRIATHSMRKPRWLNLDACIVTKN